MPNEEKERIPITSILGSLAAITAVTSGLLFYIGYLFLLGFYRAFNLRIELLELSAQDIMAESGTLLVPLSFIVLLHYLVWLFLRSRNLVFSETLQKWRWGVRIGIILYVLLLTSTIPSTGEWFANRFVSNHFTAYNYLAKPLPSVVMFSKEPLPSLPSEEVDNGFHVYRGLRLAAANKANYFLFNRDMRTYVVPRTAVSIVFIH